MASNFALDSTDITESTGVRQRSTVLQRPVPYLNATAWCGRHTGKRGRLGEARLFPNTIPRTQAVLYLHAGSATPRNRGLPHDEREYLELFKEQDRRVEVPKNSNDGVPLWRRGSWDPWMNVKLAKEVEAAYFLNHL